MAASNPDPNPTGNPPAHLVCGLTKKLFVDPVIIANGATYEREAIQQHFTTGRDDGQYCPLTGQYLRNKEMIPNRAIGAAVMQWSNVLSGTALSDAVRQSNLGVLKSQRLVLPINPWQRLQLLRCATSLPVLRFLIEECKIRDFYADRASGGSEAEADADGDGDGGVQSVLEWWCAHNGLPVFEYLINECKLDVNRSSGSYKRTPLLTVCASQAPDAKEKVRLLIAAGADVNAKDKSGTTALYFSSSVEISRMLVEAGANPRVKRNDGCSILHALSLSLDDLKYRLSLFGDKSKQVQAARSFGASKSLLYYAEGNTDVIDFLLSPPYSLDPTVTDRHGQSLLHWWFTSSDIDWSEETYLGVINLCRAAIERSVVGTGPGSTNLEDEVELIDLMDSHGRTALHYAIEEACTPGVIALLVAGASTEIGDPTARFFLSEKYEVDGVFEIAMRVVELARNEL